MNVLFISSNVVMIILLSNVVAEPSWPYHSPRIKAVFLLNPRNNYPNIKTGIARSGYGLEDERKKMKKEILIRKQHRKRMAEIEEFMETHLSSTNYFYQEMKRIKEQRVIRSPLRKMIDWLDEPNHRKEKKEVFRCFMNVRREKELKSIDIWKEKVNNLVIDVVKDPFNDGTVH